MKGAEAEGCWVECQQVLSRKMRSKKKEERREERRNGKRRAKEVSYCGLASGLSLCRVFSR